MSIHSDTFEFYFYTSQKKTKISTILLVIFLAKINKFKDIIYFSMLVQDEYLDKN